ncbi:HlyD family secretion protein [Fulvivirga maritima]|uniref:HlyD family efflux transporter periplasmic adaptor subunit n=1 Tax=Fulvivirga maritima TaxID=2904247 RepID=UPI001F3C6981|nr:HlyD family efflux transporter periplasmic adaptor subunit [Fulvivirga maritima]UII26789.1 HlyD family secretion protein [Fulvivirga maritima]
MHETFLANEKDMASALFQNHINLQQAIKKMLAAISEWERKYIIKAPIAGSVTYLKKFATNQFITPDEAIASVVPDHGTYTGKVSLPVNGSGKVKPGQTVIIHLYHYPSQEYGTLKGKVEELSLVPNEGDYLISVSLDHQLRTSYLIDIPFKQHLSGSAHIITEDMSLLARLFGHIRSLFDNKINL